MSDETGGEGGDAGGREAVNDNVPAEPAGAEAPAATETASPEAANDNEPAEPGPGDEPGEAQPEATNDNVPAEPAQPEAANGDVQAEPAGSEAPAAPQTANGDTSATAGDDGGKEAQKSNGDSSEQTPTKSQGGSGFTDATQDGISEGERSKAGTAELGQESAGGQPPATVTEAHSTEGETGETRLDAGTAVEDAGLRQVFNSAASAELKEAFHYTREHALAKIIGDELEPGDGLMEGSYLTPDGTLSPLQAQIDLALAPNRGLQNVLIRVDLAGLRAEGYPIPKPRQIARVGKRRVHGSDEPQLEDFDTKMPGGGYEMQFDYPIPRRFLEVIRK